ncbi:MAG: AAA family ATPase [Bacteroidales bacterium]|jgi:predicted AAA+ superfamily ATPase|nr:AAA family ATPase [Bacteroidales bacterium]
MFHRNAIDELRKWAKTPHRKPLILRGARQVGKTTLVDEFAEDFEIYLKLNLEEEDDRNIFEQHSRMDSLLIAIYLHNEKPRKAAKTLLFIDEIQNSPKAVAKLRFFYEKAPHIHVIAAGSLLESLIDIHIHFPVGRVEYMAVRPCSFNEFLGAMGRLELKEFHQKALIPEALHPEVLGLFNTYTLIGGMPEVVNNYAHHKDIVSLQKIYESLLTGYRDDVEKYENGNTLQHVLQHILNVGWTYASQRITFERFGNSAYRSREMSEAFKILEKAMLLELAYPTTSELIPLVPEPKRAPKLLWFDTGLVNYAAGLQKELFGRLDIRDAWRGMIAEHIVGQALLTSDHRFSHRRNFWMRDANGSTAEVDYVIQIDNQLVPIEVKAGHNAKLRSLHQFMDKVSHKTAIRFWCNPLSVDKVKTPSGKEFLLYNLPYYYAGQINEIVNNQKYNIKNIK